MSRSSEAASMKRKMPYLSRCTNDLVDAERQVLSVVKSRKNIGIWAADVKKETNLSPLIVEKALASLKKKELIKLVVNVQNKGKKHYMAVEFKPSEEVTGGAWFTEDGTLDKEFIAVLRKICIKVLDKVKVATVEGIHSFVMKHELAVCTWPQVAKILECMVLEDVIKEVKSTGLAEYHSIPVGSVCFQIASGPKIIGNMASIPCGACPRISQCTPNGIISPQTCAYYSKWLKLEF